jgi:TonB family protein
MSVEPLDSMSDVWTKWQGHLVNGVFRLGRYLGGTEHSGVFLSLFGEREPVEVALKLIPVTPAGGQTQLSHLRAAAGLSHPQLIRLLQTGRCELDGQSYLYIVMEYADQSLAQLLRKRPLTEDEAREMLGPMLEALAFLHGRNLVQGQLKPANILAVGDHLKLASDTVRPISEAGAGRSSVSVYDPPEYRDGSYSTAGDIWGLGMSLLEALSQRTPAGLDDGRGVVAVPPDFSPAFRDIVVQCLSRRPYDRPKVTEIDAWLRRRAAEAAWVWAPEPAAMPEARAVKRPEAVPPLSAPAGQGARAATAPEAPWPRPLVPLLVAAVVLLALLWAGVRALRTHSGPAPVATQAPATAAPQPAGATAPAIAGQRTPPAQASVPAVLHEEIPDVPLHARQTIHGRIRISVRVIIDGDGKVMAARADQAGPSRYFERLAIEAAKKWTFPPTDTPARRLKQIRFEFSRDGVKGRAVPLP